jgi:hypothetical protein
MPDLHPVDKRILPLCGSIEHGTGHIFRRYLQDMRIPVSQRVKPSRESDDG